MAPRRALLLHKTEWERIIRKEQSNSIHTNEYYVKSLNEQSQKWIKSWPDSVQGHVCQYEKQKRIQREKNIAFVKDYTSKSKIKNDNYRDSIKQARDLIFEDSCYGKQLISALLESKAIEERNVQIEFQKKIKDAAKSLEEALPLCNSIESAEEMEKKEKMLNLKQREDNLRTAEINKFIIKKKEEDKNKGHIEMVQAITDEIIKSSEEMEKDKQKQNIKKELDDYMMERDKIKEKRNKKEIETLKYIEKIRDDRERLNSKIKAVNNKIIKERNSNRTANVYNQLKLLKEEEQLRYDKFIESGLKRHSLDAEQVDKLKQTNNEKRENFLETVTSMRNNKAFDKCFCDRQCILSKPCKNRRFTMTCIPKIDQQILVHKKPVDEYKKRQKMPSDWSGLNAAHAQFASHATAIINECQYKQMARKVVREYWRTNCLDGETLMPKY